MQPHASGIAQDLILVKEFQTCCLKMLLRGAQPGRHGGIKRPGSIEANQVLMNEEVMENWEFQVIMATPDAKQTRAKMRHVRHGPKKRKGKIVPKDHTFLETNTITPQRLTSY